MEIENDDHPSSLTDSQEKILSILVLFSGFLSVMGSSTIVWKVIKRRKQSTPYDRIMLGLSSCDIVASLSFGLTPYLMPKATSGRVWALGNDTTCNVLGTSTQLGFAAVFYNCMLSVYYLVTVRFGVKRKQFEEKYEIWIHFLTLFYFSVTAMVGAIFEVYAPVDVGFGCWVNDYPRGCELTGDCLSQEIGWAFGGGPTVVTFLALIINNIVIYVHVRRSFQGGIWRNVSASSESANIKSGMTAEEALNRKREKRKRSRSREVATQGFLYVVTFAIAYTPAFVVRAIEAFTYGPVDDASFFPLLVINAIFLPLQGFFNMFVYNRPKYTRIRIAYPNLSIIQAIYQVICDPDLPRMTKPPKNSMERTLSNTSRNKMSRFSSNLAIVEEASNEDDNSFVTDTKDNSQKTIYAIDQTDRCTEEFYYSSFSSSRPRLDVFDATAKGSSMNVEYFDSQHSDDDDDDDVNGEDDDINEEEEEDVEVDDMEGGESKTVDDKVNVTMALDDLVEEIDSEPLSEETKSMKDRSSIAISLSPNVRQIHMDGSIQDLSNSSGSDDKFDDV